MANQDRVEVSLSGGSMGVGFARFHFNAGTASGHLAALHDLWASVAGSMPNTVTIRVPGSGDTIEENTGHIVGSWAGAAPAVLYGAANAGYAAGVGMRARWMTNTMRNGRRIIGSTFFVPLSGGAYESDGSILPTVIATNQTAINTFLTAVGSDFNIWSRGPGPNTGLTGTVLTGTLVDRTSWLTSRRT